MATKPIRLTRQSLAQFLKDQKQIKAFESLFEITEQVSENPDTLGTGIEAASAMALAASVRSLAESLRAAVDVVASAPAVAKDNAVSTDYIELHGDGPNNLLPRTMYWSNSDDTLVINHSDDVHQQVGLETFVRFVNQTGAVINNGTILGLSGGILVPYLANGATPMLNIVGMATQAIPAVATGRATVFGGVNGLNTTGTPYGETWLQGDTVYASPTVAGGLTKVKPTAPALAIPLGIVTSVSATVGRIFVRPTIDQPLYYGSFVKTVDTTPAAINTAYPVTFDSATIANGLAIGTPASRIVAANAGLYSISCRMQMTSGSASVKNVWFWFRKNGVDIANTATVVSLDTGTAVVSPSIKIMVSLKANDYIELVWASDSTNITLDSRAATAFAPSSPGVSMVISQEQQ